MYGLHPATEQGNGDEARTIAAGGDTETRAAAAEVARLQRELSKTKTDQACLREENEQLKATIEDLQQQVLTDPLTGLGNRRSLWEQLTIEVERAEVSGRSFVALIVDIDYFKRVNDTYGHLTGDLVLRQMAQLLRSDLRADDVVVPVDADTITLARFGGEEFVVVLPDTPLDGGQRVANRLREMIQDMAFHSTDRHPLPTLTISVGIAEYDLELDCFDFEGVLNRADRALYEAKAAGRNTIRPLMTGR